ncbi:hypothetical protein [Pyrobaculum aerophilum]|uniref:hypothetical protein n=1 Tax=Pyrobaculum aerophilum TaxID=13773 RepID=UPI001D048940|nr:MULTISPECIES: hypothetical protein [Pyrobaculum]MCX8135844.1 hypothetical protein [Pyrobaculum aerophilum]
MGQGRRFSHLFPREALPEVDVLVDCCVEDVVVVADIYAALASPSSGLTKPHIALPSVDFPEP